MYLAFVVMKFSVLFWQKFLYGGLFKGTHAQYFQSLFLNFFFIYQSLKDTKRSTANISENILKIRTDIQSFW